MQFLILSLVSSILLIAEVPGTMKNQRLTKGTIQEWKFFDINTIQCTINSSGPYADYLHTNSSGLFWPRGTNKTAVYTAGIWIIGKHGPSGSLRTAVQDYSTEFQPGPILSTYNTQQNSVEALGDPADPKYRIYKVHRRDSLGGNPDYDNWPVDLGAPFIDVNGDGIYNNGIDKPFLWGDQVLWSVYNDGNPTQHLAAGNTKPMGIEVQATYFGFDQPGPLGNIMFMRWKIINKSDADYDSVFISMWSDTDLGDAIDDFAAVDTLRNLAYVYNADNDDNGANGYGSKPPACGFVFLQGPRIQSINDTALSEGKKIAGYKNLPGTSHVVYFNNGGGIGWIDPPLRNDAFAEQAYRYQNGLLGSTGLPFIDPISGIASKFVFSGDPIDNAGWLHANTATAQDVRSMISSGPFTLAVGDTQEVVGAFVIGQGFDRLHSIEQLRSFVDTAQYTFNNNFLPPQKPLNPFRVSFSPLPNSIILEWGNPHIYSTTEQFTFFGMGRDYRFEGYNVYQYPENTISAVPKLIAVFDVKNSITNVSDWIFDPLTGTMKYGTVAEGTDSGIRRHFTIDNDIFKGEPLIKNKPYYFAVTSYYYNHDIDGILSGMPKIIESPRIPFAVTPMDLLPGNSILAGVGQSLPTNHSLSGKDAVTATVINPYAVSGGTYEITFNGLDTGVTSWNLKNISVDQDRFILKEYPHFLNDDTSPIIDGVQFFVVKQPVGVRRDTQEPKGYRYYPDTADIWFTAKTSIDVFGYMEAFNNGIAYPRAVNFVVKPSKVKPWNLRKIEIRFSNIHTQKAYRYLNFNSPLFGPSVVRDSSFLPFMKHRGAAGAFIYQDFVDVPFTVWEIDSIDGDFTPRQLNAGFLEKNDSLRGPNGEFIGNGKIDGKWDPTHAPSGASELLFIFNSNYSPDTLSQYTRNPLSPTNTSQFLNLRTQLDSVDVLYVLWVRRKDSTATFKEGERFEITPNYPLFADDIFTITVPKNTSVGREKEGIPETFELHQNYPNPFNPITTISFQLPKNEMVTLKVYNILGQEIRNLVSEVHQSGYYSVQWNGENSTGVPVTSGVYFYVMSTPSYSSVKKMVLLK